MSENENGDDEQQAADDWAEAMAEQAQEEAKATKQDEPKKKDEAPKKGAPEDRKAPKKDDKANVSKARMAELEDEGDGDDAGDDAGGLERNMDVIMDIPVTLAMEIGRTQISIRNLLQLNQGSVVELDRLAGEPLDVLVNGTLIAHGEVVVVNDRFGIRLTDVISPSERVKKLK